MNIIKSMLLFLLMMVAAGCAVQTRPVLTPFADGEFWVVTQPLAYPVPDSDAVIIIPEGFVTDFASIPRIFWTIFPRHGEYTTAAIVHDFLYWDQKCTREQADNLFDLVMRDAEVSMASRYAIYGAVRLGGGLAWAENETIKAEGEVRVIPAELMNFGVKTKWVEFRDVLRVHRANIDEPMEQDGNIPLYCSALDKDKDEDEGKDKETPVPETSPEPEADGDPATAVQVNHSEEKDLDTVDTILDE